jgi:hypothetical protein
MPTKKKTTGTGKKKVHKVMSEYKHGSLKSGGGGKVKNRKQAVAIALSEARSAGAKIPKKKSTGAKKKTAAKKKTTAKKAKKSKS